jgi:hypothetical protein
MLAQDTELANLSLKLNDFWTLGWGGCGVGRGRSDNPSPDPLVNPVKNESEGLRKRYAYRE